MERTEQSEIAAVQALPQRRPTFRTAVPVAGRRSGDNAAWRGDWTPWLDVFGTVGDESGKQLSDQAPRIIRGNK